MKLLQFPTVAVNAAGEVEIPRFGDIEKGVAIIHVQDRIFEVAAVVGFPRHLDHGILAWRVQEKEGISDLEVMGFGPVGVDFGIGGGGNAPSI